MTSIKDLQNKLAGLELELEVTQRKEYEAKEAIKTFQRAMQTHRKELNRLVKRRKEIQSDLDKIPKRITKIKWEVKNLVSKTPGQALEALERLSE